MHRFTLGVEEEFQIVDPQTWELRSHVIAAARRLGADAGRSDQAELHQSIVEVGTRICADVAELRDEIFRIRHELVSAAERAGLAVAAAGTHPFSHWKDQVISPGVRYDSIVEELQQLARSLLIFGLHVHVAVPDQHDDDRPDERGALLPAAPAGAVDQLAVLDGPRHRPQVVPDDDLPALPAHRRARSLRLVERLRELRPAARRPALHRRREEDLVGRAAAPDLRHARVPRLRRADAARGRGDARRARSRRSSSSCAACAPATRASASIAGR